jgi:hypothetical protein
VTPTSGSSRNGSTSQSSHSGSSSTSSSVKATMSALEEAMPRFLATALPEKRSLT